LKIDVFDKAQQWAKPLPTLKPVELIEAILQEFRELEFLSDSAADYYLTQSENGEGQLHEDTSLAQQLTNNSRLKLLEVERPLPQGTERPSTAIYLREQASGKVYKLHWLPAIIGRPDNNQAGDERISVDLEAYRTGLRVSRRHAQITEKDGRYFIESASRNPTSLKDEAGESVAVTEEKQPLKHGDVIQLERSNIALKFIIRE
jgi:hypothetical protein